MEKKKRLHGDSHLIKKESLLFPPKPLNRQSWEQKVFLFFVVAIAWRKIVLFFFSSDWCCRCRTGFNLSKFCKKKTMLSCNFFHNMLGCLTDYYFWNRVVIFWVQPCQRLLTYGPLTSHMFLCDGIGIGIVVCMYLSITLIEYVSIMYANVIN